ncbi:hypothetical protein JHK87_034160 [Glycine soja]|nr:hypothetical protein JHK87_034160 [Glycine soja]
MGTYTGEIAVRHSTSAVGETHTYGDNGGKPSISLKSETLSTTPKAAACELTSQERDSALLRYKQKKKTRSTTEIGQDSEERVWHNLIKWRKYVNQDWTAMRAHKFP